jgi:hypothetical protein
MSKVEFEGFLRRRRGFRLVVDTAGNGIEKSAADVNNQRTASKRTRHR